MIDNFFADLGLTEEQVAAKQLNGKYIAILRRNGNSGDPKIITVTEETAIQDADRPVTLEAGDILAHENPIHVQEITERLYPDQSGLNNPGGKHILFCYIPKNLSYF